MAESVKLKDLYAAEQTYNGINTVAIPKADGSGNAYYVQRPTINYTLIDPPSHEIVVDGVDSVFVLNAGDGDDLGNIFGNAYGAVSGKTTKPIVTIVVDKYADGIVTNDNGNALILYLYEELPGSVLKEIINFTGAIDFTAGAGWGQLLLDNNKSVTGYSAITDISSVVIGIEQPGGIVNADIFYSLLSEVTQESQSVEVTENGSQTIVPTAGKSGIRKVALNINVPSSGGNLQEKSVSITSNGTTEVTPDAGYDGMSKVTAVVNVAGCVVGGGSVSFIDYDGTVIETWALSSLASKTELPTPPAHDRLVFQQWNWTLEDIKAANAEMTVGALYTTASGLTEFHIRVTKVSGLTITCNMVGNKNWGDGTEDALTSHTYSDYGDYIITCDGAAIASNVMGNVSKMKHTLLHASIPNSVTSIGDNAFPGCSALQSVSIPNSVTSIGNRAFSSCRSLQSISIPNSVASIGKEAFPYCYSLQSISIPNSVTSIGYEAFYNCRSLQSISIPNSVASIGDQAFYNCSALQSVSISNSVTSIGNETFYNCSALQSVSIPNGVTSIGYSAFEGCVSLQSISISNGVTSIGDGAFYNCCSLQSISIPNSVTSIGGSVFHNCSALQSISIPNGVTSIGAQVFYNCYSLQSISIPNGVTSIGNQAFYYCYVLQSIPIPNSVTSIGNEAFYNCPASQFDFSQFSEVPTIGTGVFDGILLSARILVPSALYDTWVVATNWKKYANYIVGV